MVTEQPETLLMVSIFQQAFPLDPEGSLNDYMAFFALEIDRTCRVLEYLGLAERALGSHLGWKPTPRLMKIIAERVILPFEKSKYPMAADHRKFVSSFILRATGDVRQDPTAEAFEFICSVLVALGFLQQVASGRFKPTGRLRDLVLEGTKPAHA